MSTIHIKKSHEGKFTAYKKRTGKTTEEALHSSNPHVRQMANFARNAAQWDHSHAYGGDLDDTDDGENIFARGGSVAPSRQQLDQISRYEGSSMATNAPHSLKVQEFNNILTPQQKQLLNQNQIDALYSYYYNVKPSTFKKQIIPELNKLERSQDTQDFNTQLAKVASKINTGMGSKKYPGLTKRRLDEQALFLYGDRNSRVPASFQSAGLQLPEYSKPELAAFSSGPQTFAPDFDLPGLATALQVQNQQDQNYENPLGLNVPDYMFATGGDLQTGQTHGADFTNGIVSINNGGTHEQNPNDGVQMGVDDKGTPNLVEQGEVKFKDYIYSNRMAPTAEMLQKAGLPVKYKNHTYADIAEKLGQESQERPNDPISINSLQVELGKLKNIQEEHRQATNKENTQQYHQNPQTMQSSQPMQQQPEQQQDMMDPQLMQQLEQQQDQQEEYSPQEDQGEYAYGGPLQALVNGINKRSTADFVTRLKDPNRQVIPNWNNPNQVSTHKMSYATTGNNQAIVFPMIQNVNGKLMDYTNPKNGNYKQALNKAIQNKDTLMMTVPEAAAFTDQYKNYYPSFDKYAYGGNLGNMFSGYGGKGNTLKQPVKGIKSVLEPTGLPSYFDNTFKVLKYILALPTLMSHKNDPVPIDTTNNPKALQQNKQKVVKKPIVSSTGDTGTRDNKLTGAKNTDNKNQTYTGRYTGTGRYRDNKSYHGYGTVRATVPTTPVINSALELLAQPHTYVGDVNNSPLAPKEEKPSWFAPWQDPNYKLPGQDYTQSRIDQIFGEKAPTYFPKETPDQDIVDNNNGPKTPEDRLSYLRYAPILGSAGQVISDIFGLTNTPDYSVYDNLQREASRPAEKVNFQPISGYERYIPMDTREPLSVLGQNGAATLSAMRNASLGNRGTLGANMAALSYNQNNSIGKLYAAAQEYNNNLRQNVDKYNTGINQYNSTGSMQAQTANQEAELNNRRMTLSTLQDIANQRQNMDQQFAAARSANRNGLFADLGSLGREAYYMNQANSNPSFYFTAGNNGLSFYKGTPRTTTTPAASTTQDTDPIKQAFGGFLRKYKKH